MTKGSSIACIVDTHGLHAIATASGNRKAILLEQLSTGAIAVPSFVFHEFSTIYEDEAQSISSAIHTKLKRKDAYYIGAASIADKYSTGFPSGAYDESVELHVASVAMVHDCHILTTPEQLDLYTKLGRTAYDADAWISQLSAA